MRHGPAGPGAMGGAECGVREDVGAGTAGAIDLTCLCDAGVAVACGAEEVAMAGDVSATGGGRG